LSVAEKPVYVYFCARPDVDFSVRDGWRNEFDRISRLVSIIRSLCAVPIFLGEIVCIVGMQDSVPGTCCRQGYNRAVHSRIWTRIPIQTGINRPDNSVAGGLRRNRWNRAGKSKA